jgi:parvulin-like peptidyl-prolyl isomerase
VERRRRPARLALAAAAAVLALVATSCSDGIGRPADAATVGDRVITRADLDAQIELLQERQEALAGEDDAALEGLLESFRGDGDGTVPTQVAAEALSELIDAEIREATLESLGGEVTDELVSAARADLEEQAAAQQVDLAEFPAAFIDQQVRLIAIDQALVDLVEVSDEELEEAYAERSPALQQLCVSLLLVETEQDAQAAYDRVLGGEAFADVAREVSIDPATAESGGEAGCASAAEVAQSFGPTAPETPVGVPFEPLQFTQGWAVAVITGRQVPPIEEVGESLRQELVQARRAELATEVAADVEVDPRFGTWDASTGIVVPPQVPAPAADPAGLVIDPATGAPVGS